jgi:hypothetical protein
LVGAEQLSEPVQHDEAIGVFDVCISAVVVVSAGVSFKIIYFMISILIYWQSGRLTVFGLVEVAETVNKCKSGL